MTTARFDLPFRFSDGRAVTVQADGQADIQNCVEALLRTTRGERLEEPEYGIPDMTFASGGPSVAPIREAIDRWEPRARYAAEADGSDLDTMIGRVRVTMQEAGAVSGNG